MAKLRKPNLTHEELAALDLVILSALQQGKGLDDTLSFIDVIGHALAHAIDWVANNPVTAIETAAHVAQIVAQVTAAAGAAGSLGDDEVAAISEVVSATVDTRQVTLQELIEIRRRAAAGSKPHR